jgi:Cu-Zn family superoxide dismutase
MATFQQTADGVMVQARISGMRPGLYAAHLHTTGLCEGPGFESAGGHWNPTGAQHGLNNPAGAHTGDLLDEDQASLGSNFRAGTDGVLVISGLSRGATLDSGPRSLFDGDGTALVVHAGSDDNMSDPSGNSGARMACGVVVPASGPRANDGRSLWDERFSTRATFVSVYGNLDAAAAGWVRERNATR